MDLKKYETREVIKPPPPATLSHTPLSVHRLDEDLEIIVFIVGCDGTLFRPCLVH